MAKEGGAGRARGAVRAGEYGARAHSDIRTRPGGVFAVTLIPSFIPIAFCCLGEL